MAFIDALTITAANKVTPDATQSFTLTVTVAPAITSATTASFAEGAAGTFTVTTTGSPSPAITGTGDALPTGVTFTDNKDGTATLAGTPAAGTAKSYAITIKADNGVGTAATQSFTLTVAAAPSESTTIPPTTTPTTTPVAPTTTATTSATAAAKTSLPFTGGDPKRMVIGGLIFLDLGYLALSATWSRRRRRT